MPTDTDLTPTQQLLAIAEREAGLLPYATYPSYPRSREDGYDLPVKYERALKWVREGLMLDLDRPFGANGAPIAVDEHGERRPYMPKFHGDGAHYPNKTDGRALVTLMAMGWCTASQNREGWPLALAQGYHDAVRELDKLEAAEAEEAERVAELLRQPAFDAGSADWQAPPTSTRPGARPLDKARGLRAFIADGTRWGMNGAEWASAPGREGMSTLTATNGHVLLREWLPFDGPDSSWFARDLAMVIDHDTDKPRPWTDQPLTRELLLGLGVADKLEGEFPRVDPAFPRINFGWSSTPHALARVNAGEVLALLRAGEKGRPKKGDEGRNLSWFNRSGIVYRSERRVCHMLGHVTWLDYEGEPDLTPWPEASGRRSEHRVGFNPGLLYDVMRAMDAQAPVEVRFALNSYGDAEPLSAIEFRQLDDNGDTVRVAILMPMRID